MTGSRYAGVDREAPRSFVPSIPQAERYQMCTTLLSELGAGPVTEKGHELVHGCLLPFKEHQDQGRNPTASLNYDLLLVNCLGCGHGGTIWWFIATVRGITTDEARNWARQYESTDAENVAALLNLFDELYDRSRGSVPPLPHYDSSILDPWVQPNSLGAVWLTAPREDGGRGIPPSSLDRFSVGFDPSARIRIGEEWVDSQRIVIPHFWNGAMVGWQSRRLLDDGTAKYTNTPDFPKDTTLFNHDPTRRALIVESPMSVLSKADAAGAAGFSMEATFGASLPTDRVGEQAKAIARHPDVTLWFDNDESGWHATETLTEQVSPYCPVYVVPSDLDADPADLDDATFLDLLASRVPAPLWRRPREVIEVA